MTHKRPTVSERKLEALLALPGPERYEHFVKTVADWELAWGLYSEGWALAADDDGRPAFPLWPAEEFARACAGGEWEDYSPEEIALEDLVNELLPKLERDSVLVAVFPTPSDRGVVVVPQALGGALEEASADYL